MLSNINTPASGRPLRTVVSSSFVEGIEDINHAYEGSKSRLWASLGMGAPMNPQGPGFWRGAWA